MVEAKKREQELRQTLNNFVQKSQNFLKAAGNIEGKAGKYVQIAALLENLRVVMSLSSLRAIPEEIETVQEAINSFKAEKPDDFQCQGTLGGLSRQLSGLKGKIEEFITSTQDQKNAEAGSPTGVSSNPQKEIAKPVQKQSEPKAAPKQESSESLFNSVASWFNRNRQPVPVVRQFDARKADAVISSAGAPEFIPDDPKSNQSAFSQSSSSIQN